LYQRFVASFDALAAIGRDPVTGGYRRLTWGVADRAARHWFVDEARRLGLQVDVDRNANLWAWWGPPGPDAVATGSHLDTVVDGGAFDGALGVVSAMVAVEELQRRRVEPKRPIVVAAFIEEEGARFGVPTLGTRLLTGAVMPGHVLALTDQDGTMFAPAMAGAGLEPENIGADRARLHGLAAFVELHLEQGRALVDRNAPVGIISGVWPHGRWRFEFEGRPDHAGTTRLQDRADPMLIVGDLVAAARSAAQAHDARATVGRLHIEPNTTNTIPHKVRAWLDARAPQLGGVEAMVGEVESQVRSAADLAGLGVEVTRESMSDAVEFDGELGEVLERALVAEGIEPTAIPTAAGHDAATLATYVPAAMLHVRNPTGISHSPVEYAATDDCVTGVAVLVRVLEELACR
jgi:N-carbamoyl-L-amino-acid hydrolase